MAWRRRLNGVHVGREGRLPVDGAPACARPPLGAIANAIYDAVGVRPRALPATPRVLLERLMDVDGEAGRRS